MAKKQEDSAEVSVNSTKKEILDAYQRLKEQKEQEAAQELQPEREKEQRHKKEVTGDADELAATRIPARIDGLKAEIGAALADLAGRLEAETERYRKLKEAIVAKERELEDIFAIDRSAHALAALIEAQKQKKAEFEEDLTRRRLELDEEMKKTKTTWEKEKAEYAARTQEQKSEDQKIRKRDQEEYEYNLKREREQKTNALRDEIASLEKEIATKREEFARERAANDADLKRREEAVSLAEKELQELQMRVENFPKELDEAVKRAVKEVSDRLNAEAKKNEELMCRSHEGERNVAATRIQSFEQLVAEQKKQVELLSGQLEKAYGKVQDIAIKAVSGARDRHYPEPGARTQAGEEK